MRHLIACLIALASLPALAGPVEKCRAQMALGLCVAQKDTIVYPPTAKVIIGPSRYSLNAYNVLRNAGDGRDTPTGPVVRPDMCDLAAEALANDPKGEVAQISRALWR